MNGTRLWILGAADHEMVAVEKLLADAHEQVIYAMVGGARVHPGNMYRADNIGSATDAVKPGELILVECGWINERYAPSVELGSRTDVDHHRPGDPGYGRPPEDFLAASSIGQSIGLLARTAHLPAGEMFGPGPWGRLPWMIEGMPGQMIPAYTAPGCDDPDWWVYTGPVEIARIPRDLLMTAAADHCLEAAYRGRCPGVDPAALLEWRVAQKAAFRRTSCKTCGGTGRVPDGTHGCQQCGVDDHADCYNSNEQVCHACSEAAVMADIEAARTALRMAIKNYDPDPNYGDCRPAEYADLRGRHVPELPEAACRDGIPYLSSVVDPDGREKVVLGAAPPSLVQRFLAGDVVAGLTGYYGDPARGFAGGYPISAGQVMA